MPTWDVMKQWYMDTSVNAWLIDPFMEPAICRNCNRVIIPLIWPHKPAEQKAQWFTLATSHDGVCTEYKNSHCPDEWLTLLFQQDLIGADLPRKEEVLDITP